jgi:hypothetical protein
MSAEMQLQEAGLGRDEEEEENRMTATLHEQRETE